MKKRSSFFSKLSGSVPIHDDYDAFDDDLPVQRTSMRESVSAVRRLPEDEIQPPSPFLADEDESSEGQLPVDVYQTPNEIVVKTFIAGVRPDEMNVSISRDMVVIDGARQESTQVGDSDYFSRELFWGSFSKTILLPQEVDVENSSATAKDGVLTLILPKLDKARQTKLRVKTG